MGHLATDIAMQQSNKIDCTHTKKQIIILQLKTP